MKNSQNNVLRCVTTQFLSKCYRNLKSKGGLIKTQIYFAIVLLPAMVMNAGAQQTISSVNVVQTLGCFAAPATNELVLKIEIVTTGVGTPVSVIGFPLDLNNATINANYLANLKIYSTGSSPTFNPNSPGTLFLNISNPQPFLSYPATGNAPQVLSSGSNYFWLTFNVNAGATSGVLDARIYWIETSLGIFSYPIGGGSFDFFDPLGNKPLANSIATPTVSPINTTICYGSKATLKVTSPLTNPLNHFEWYINNCPVGGSGTSGASYTTPNLTSLTNFFVKEVGGGCNGQCQYITVNVYPQIIIPTPTVTNVSCHGNCNGTITVNPSGGNPFPTPPNFCPYGISITPLACGNTGSNFFQCNTFSGYGPGTYTITVTDANGCTASTSATITEPPALTAAITFPIDPCCPHLDVAGGTQIIGSPPYSYAWSFGQPPTSIYTSTTTDFICPLSDGPYYVTVTDAHNCTARANAVKDCNPCTPSKPCSFWALGGNSIAKSNPMNPNNILGINDPLITDPLKFYTHGSEKMQISSNGEIGINTGLTGPTAGTRLQIKGSNQNGVLSQVSSSGFYTYPGPPPNYAIRGEFNGGSGYFANSGFAGYFWSRPSFQWAGYFVGDVRVTHKLQVNSIWYPSDLKLKKNIENITNALSAINQLSPKSFDFKVAENPYLDLPEGNQFGFISQEVHTVLPNLVDSVNYAPETDSLGNIVYQGGTYLGLNYNSIIPLAIAGIKELDLKVTNLSASSLKVSSPLTLYHIPKSCTGDSMCNSQIYDNGFCVGIGTDSVPLGYKCVVEGKFGARDVIVACPPSWPDYVFDASHTLKPLDELENYVTANKHLPGIPAAAEIEKGGINVGEMQTKQMEKIEELYQYIIEMNKNMQKLSDENRQLKDRMKKMENK